MKNDLIRITEGRTKIEFDQYYNQITLDLLPQLKESNGSEIINYQEIQIIDLDLIFKVKNIHSHNQIKNIIFTPSGPKPEIVIDDALENNIKIVKNEEFCLIY